MKSYYVNAQKVSARHCDMYEVCICNMTGTTMI